MQNNVPVTLLDFLNYSTKLLKEKNISDARLNVELMLCEVLKCDRVKLYLNFEKPLSASEINIFREYLKRRLSREPIQYILEKTSFYGFEFKVNRKVLIPRPETELIVEKIINDIKENKKEKVSIFEIGTGSGCISITLAKILESENIKYDIFSIDKSKDAIEIANQNLQLLVHGESKVKFYLKDVFEINKLTKNFDYIVSNPPYISNEEYKSLEPEVRNFEPDVALTDFGTGLKFIERIILISSDKEFTGKVFCEIGFGQRHHVELLLEENGINDYLFYDDYSGINRILEIRK